MSNYTKLTDFASKDALPTGNAAKIVKGTEIDDELEAIETAIATKPDATDVDASILAARQNAWPIGSVYINASATTNPATLLGFGTWVEIGQGRVLVGQDTGDGSFDSMGETGGSKDAVVVSHSHTGSTNTTGSHSHGLDLWSGPPDFTYLRPTRYSSGSYAGQNSGAIKSAGDHSHTVTVNSTGESGTNKNLQPYLVVKMWQRTA